MGTWRNEYISPDGELIGSGKMRGGIGGLFEHVFLNGFILIILVNILGLIVFVRYAKNEAFELELFRLTPYLISFLIFLFWASWAGCFQMTLA
jgi:hypothetical protein